MIHLVVREDELERDVQDVFITRIEIRDGALRAENELGEVFAMGLDTGKVWQSRLAPDDGPPPAPGDVNAAGIALWREAGLDPTFLGATHNIDVLLYPLADYTGPKR
jgi:hypothetical protein